MEQLTEKWLKLDKNPKTRQEILQLKEQGNTEELSSRLSNPLTFGTSGLRAQMGAGFARMNELTVIQATQGVAAYLLEQKDLDKSKGIVIGHDHRHNSWDFARVTAAVFLSKGFKVYFYDELVHTPMVPFTVLKHKALCGIMITASHNPKDDNGYKLYWSNGCQIISPIDKNIQKLIERHSDEVWIWDKSLVDSNSNVVKLGQETISEYIAALKTKFPLKDFSGDSFMNIVYTPVHGVGLKFAELLFQAYGFKKFHSVPEQSQPDPDFPTVKYPNPEEGPEVLDLSIKLANANDCSIIFATDPDADRLAICERIGSEWKMLNGNQIGSILGAHLYELYKSAFNDDDNNNNNNNNKQKSNAAMLITTVSSKFLHKLARKNNFLVEETLTGFKWLGNRALELMSTGYDVLFAYEEAIGFMVSGDIVPDKDGISALLVAYCLATKLYSQGKTLHDYLEQLYREYGYCCSLNSYFRITEPKLTTGIFHNIRHYSENGYPTSIGNYRIDRVRDLSTGYDSSTPTKTTTTLPSSKSSQVITFWCKSIESGFEFTITFRTSGTEPKLKYYSEICGNYDKRNELQEALKHFVNAMTETLLQPDQNHLKPK